MTYLEYLQLPDSVASLNKFYAFGVVSEAQYIRSELLLAYIDLRQQSPRPSDSECGYLLSKNPYYALSEGSILQIIKWAKRKG